MLSFVKLDRVPPMDVIQRLSARRKILDGRELFLTVFGGPKACGFTAWAWEEWQPRLRRSLANVELANVSQPRRGLSSFAVTATTLCDTRV